MLLPARNLRRHQALNLHPAARAEAALALAVQEGEAEPVEERAEAEERLVEQAVGLRPLLWLT